ncbi:MAG: hypothetical protein KJ571_02305 [Bacteroidetes bacterium]|nr:hypothetical protein [Bacteroidota bacterium]
MHIIRNDVTNNRCYVTLSGVISYNEAEEIKEKIIKETEMLKPGFDIINNISKYIQGDESGASILQEIVNHLIDKKVNRIIRVVGTSKTGLIQFAKFTPQDKNLNIHYFPTMEDAAKFLENN